MCQQHIYTSSFQQLKRVLDAGDIGRTTEIHATTSGNLSDRGTHYTHYLLWASGFAQAAVGGGARPRPHPVAGYPPVARPVPGAAGARRRNATGLGEYGGGGAALPTPGTTWQVNRLTVRGTEGTVWAENTGIWATQSRATKGEWDAW